MDLADPYKAIRNPGICRGGLGRTIGPEPYIAARAILIPVQLDKEWPNHPTHHLVSSNSVALKQLIRNLQLFSPWVIGK